MKTMYCAFCNMDVVEKGHISVCPNCHGQLHNQGNQKVCACCGKTYPVQPEAPRFTAPETPVA